MNTNNPINDDFGDETVTGEYIEPAEFTETDQADLDRLLADQPQTEYHSLLEVWQSLLNSADRPDNRIVTPKWAMAVISQYVGITFADMPRYVDVYFDLLAEMQQLLEDVIAEDGIECFDVNDAESDIERNSKNFFSTLRDWQLLLLTRELEWEPTDADAAVQIAALSEIQKLFFGSNGLTGHLEAIKYEFTEDDQVALAGALEERRDTLMGAK